MKTKFLLLCVMAVLITGSSFAQTVSLTGMPSIKAWSSLGAGTDPIFVDGNTLPPAAFTINLDADVSINSLTIGDGTAPPANPADNITINLNGFNLSITNDLTYNASVGIINSSGGGTLTIGGNVVAMAGSGTVTLNADNMSSVTIDGNVDISPAATETFDTGNSTITINGDFTCGGAVNADNGTLNVAGDFDGTGGTQSGAFYVSGTAINCSSCSPPPPTPIAPWSIGLAALLIIGFVAVRRLRS